jgi:hypothetical protein
VRLDREAWARNVAVALDAQNRTPGDLVDGLVSDFESGGVHASLGSWVPSPDSFAGGTSTGEIRVVDGGAAGSRHAIEITGTITDAIPFAWYGAMWTPGAQPIEPVDLSGQRGFSFQTRGDGGTYRVMVFARSRGMTPLIQTFQAGAEWREVALDWSDFGIEGTDIMGIVLAGGPQPGPFTFRVDDLRLR